MPTYAYRCKACGHEVEYFQSMSEGRKRKCPACGRSALERLIGAGAGIIFKGSGFYETDYRSESYSKAAESERGTATGDQGSGASSDAGTPKAPSEGASGSRGAGGSKGASKGAAKGPTKGTAKGTAKGARSEGQARGKRGGGASDA